MLDIQIKTVIRMHNTIIISNSTIDKGELNTLNEIMTKKHLISIGSSVVLSAKDYDNFINEVNSIVSDYKTHVIIMENISNYTKVLSLLKNKIKNVDIYQRLVYNNCIDILQLSNFGTDVNFADSNLVDSVLSMYGSGIDIETIHSYLVNYNVDFGSIVNILREGKRSSSSRLPENLRMAIANRDICGVTRSNIAKELDVNLKTIRRSCEKYGSPNKNPVNRDDEILELLDYNIKMSGDSLLCPKCNYRANSVVDSDTVFFCKNCYEEYTVLDDKIYRTRWENIN